MLHIAKKPENVLSSFDRVARPELPVVEARFNTIPNLFIGWLRNKQTLESYIINNGRTVALGLGALIDLCTKKTEDHRPPYHIMRTWHLVREAVIYV